MLVKESNTTARQAAAIFAEAYSDEGRKVGTILNRPNDQKGLLFQFVGGNRWYVVSLLPDFSGWEVKPENE